MTAQAVSTRPVAAVLERLRALRVVAVIRAPDAATAVRTAEAVLAGGIEAIELTWTTRGLPDALAALAAAHPEALLGAGTVTTRAEAETAVAAGADFLVSPGSPPGLVAAMRATGCAVLAGCLTPTEVMAALAAGAHAVKLFPASAVGPGYLAALRAPLPGLPVLPTGGIRPAEARAWLDAGAVAVGMGGALARPVHDADDAAAVTAAARAVVGALGGEP